MTFYRNEANNQNWVQESLKFIEGRIEQQRKEKKSMVGRCCVIWNFGEVEALR